MKCYKLPYIPLKESSAWNQNINHHLQVCPMPFFPLFFFNSFFIQSSFPFFPFSLLFFLFSRLFYFLFFSPSSLFLCPVGHDGVVSSTGVSDVVDVSIGTDECKMSGISSSAKQTNSIGNISSNTSGNSISSGGSSGSEDVNANLVALKKKLLQIIELHKRMPAVAYFVKTAKQPVSELKHAAHSVMIALSKQQPGMY